MIRKIKNKLLLGLVLPMVDLVYKTSSVYWLKRITELERKNSEAVNDWQLTELRKFVAHAYLHTKYYKNLFDENGIKPTDILTFEDLKKIPPIDKQIIRENHKDLIPDNIAELCYRESRSGGTTGEPLVYYCDEDTWGYITAAKIHAWQKTSYLYGDSYVALGSTSLFPQKGRSLKNILYFFIRNGIALNGVNIDNSIAEKYISLIKENKIKYIYGYTSSIFLLATYVLENNIYIGHVKGVFTTSEVLTPYYKSTIESAFNAKIQDGYGARDAGITAFEISPGEYHVGYNVVAEVVDCFEPNTGTLLCTNFLNYSFPMLRYKLGDEVELLPAGSENYNGQVIRRVLGRTSDVMRLDNGHNLSSTGFSIMIKEFNVKAFRMTKVHGLKILLELQPNDNFENTEESIVLNTIQKYVGDDCVVELKYVEGFDEIKNGKWNYFRV